VWTRKRGGYGGQGMLRREMGRCSASSLSSVLLCTCYTLVYHFYPSVLSCYHLSAPSLTPRSAIEEDYARRLQKLSKATMGKDEIGDLAAALQNCLVETAQQATYHQSLAAEIRTNVEQPTAELAARLVGFKKGQQAGIEKAWRNKGLQEGHVSKVSSHELEGWHEERRADK
jgi:hypothetical protein